MLRRPRRLEGIIAAKTAINISMATGALFYQGIEITPRCRAFYLEETVYLLWHGVLPTQQQLTTLWIGELAPSGFPRS